VGTAVNGVRRGGGEAGDRVDVRKLTAEDVRAALDRVGGVHEKAWRELGLANRHVLKRLVKKLGLREDG
jgi:transcriptional regulator with GAF, ATPase, and Fis domain